MNPPIEPEKVAILRYDLIDLTAVAKLKYLEFDSDDLDCYMDQDTQTLRVYVRKTK